MRKCAQCGNDISNGQDGCVLCGYKFNSVNVSHSKNNISITKNNIKNRIVSKYLVFPIIIMAIIIVLNIIFSMFGRMTFEECREKCNSSFSYSNGKCECSINW